jgi:hypothetical protein
MINGTFLGNQPCQGGTHFQCFENVSDSICNGGESHSFKNNNVFFSTQMTAQEVYITFTQHEGVRDSCDTWCNQIVPRLNLFLHNITLPF